MTDTNQPDNSREAFKAECDRMRAASGAVTDPRRLTAFLYLLARNQLAIGIVEELLDEACGIKETVEYTNGWLASWAIDAADRLTPAPPPTEPDPPPNVPAPIEVVEYYTAAAKDDSPPPTCPVCGLAGWSDWIEVDLAGQPMFVRGRNHCRHEYEDWHATAMGVRYSVMRPREDQS